MIDSKLASMSLASMFFCPFPLLVCFLFLSDCVCMNVILSKQVSKGHSAFEVFFSVPHNAHQLTNDALSECIMDYSSFTGQQCTQLKRGVISHLET